ncbi:hypothetical protein T310_7126 [Rasamsonia emersonii CBS 393.64]|uniref:Uncharacterized protein n=1 Tax=Rasamsonia emersonii (strain ATCC 16479 / CBS 393.64 / IMI 116815) TaxID=1408163 RepID=A0A0F4YLC0_RASE3|nr:hypothetical protein T310_7126 [Rasamsonia emersonii CBS 393.64]KKA18910.1 hypothetical protein T310_7126 [Rasamsonia emersonii CBS 393.64]
MHALFVLATGHPSSKMERFISDSCQADRKDDIDREAGTSFSGVEVWSFRPIYLPTCIEVYTPTEVIDTVAQFASRIQSIHLCTPYSRLWSKYSALVRDLTRQECPVWAMRVYSSVRSITRYRMCFLLYACGGGYGTEHSVARISMLNGY